MTVVITAFERSPDGGRGLARDTRVRWALEEVGQPYEVRLLSFEAKKEPAHLRLHPFGLIPTYEEGDVALFETGAIVLHLAEHHAGLFPDDANARARAISWMFAALNTVEPPILELVTAKVFEADEPWAQERLPLVEDRVRDRMNPLSDRLGDADWLDGAFSAADLMMASVLLRLRSSGLLDEFPNLAAYVARGEARPAYKRAFADQLAINALISKRADNVSNDDLAPDDPRRPLDPRDYSRRTLLANERTYLAWWRTGLTTLTVALAAARVVPQLSDSTTTWPYTVVGVAFGLLGVTCIAYGEVRRKAVDRAIRNGEFAEIHPAMTAAITGGGVVLGLALIVLILLAP